MIPVLFWKESLFYVEKYFDILIKPSREGEIPFLLVPGFQRGEADCSAEEQGKVWGFLRPPGREAVRRREPMRG